MTGLTARAVDAAKGADGDRYLVDSAPRGVGKLVLRVRPTGTKSWQFRATRPDGKRDVLAIGAYDPKGDGATSFTLTQARAVADEYRARGARDRNVREQLDAERRQRERASGRATADKSFRALLDHYVNRMKMRGQSSAGAVASAFRRHIPAHLGDRHAASITRGDLLDVLRPIVVAGQRREAAKLRAYLRAAFAVALKAGADPNADLVEFGLESNPAALIAQIEGHTTPGTRVLDEDELVEYILAVEALPDSPSRDLLLMQLWMGGQRPRQMLRVRRTDVDVRAKTITLEDGKGLRRTPRRYTLPLTSYPLTITKRCLDRAGGGSSYLFAGEGKGALGSTTVAVVARGVIGKLVASGKVRAEFRLGDIRRSVETRMQALGVPRDVRAVILSHGLGGTQAAHYERHSYQDEIRGALQAWSNWLGEISLA